MATREQVLSTEARIRERREAALRAQALQDACTSDSRHFVDDAGTDWEYVVLSGSSIRIERCSHAEGEVAIPDSIEGLPVRSLAPDACSSLEDVDCRTRGSAVYRGLRFSFLQAFGMRRASA